MSAKQNVELVKTYMEARRHGNLDTALEMLTDDITHTFMFDMPGVRSEWRGKEGITEFTAHVKRMLPQGSKIEIKRIHATDDSVVVESVNSGKAHNGKDYSNKYCFIYEIKNGKIKAIREYTDSHYSIENLS